MTEYELERKLNSVGKIAFVQFFYIFKEYANEKITKESAIEKMIKISPSKKESGCGNAKLIFEAKNERKALKIIAESSKLKNNVSNIIESSKQIMREHC